MDDLGTHVDFRYINPKMEPNLNSMKNPGPSPIRTASRSNSISLLMGLGYFYSGLAQPQS